MNVCIISADEPRDRQRFISKPLLRGGHKVTILKTKPVCILIYRLTVLLFLSRPDVIVFTGVGIKELIAYTLISRFNVPFIVRLGGNRLKDLDSVSSTYWSQGKYFAWAKFKSDKLFAILFLKKTNSVIVVNEALKLQISTQIKAPNKIFVVPQFTEGKTFSRDYKCGIPFNILTVTNFIFLDKAEGVIWLVHRLRNFAHQRKVKIALNIAGAGLHFHDVEKSLLPYMQSEFFTVKLLGFVDELDSYYKTTDLFVYRSFHDATPNVILESKRFSLPLLANDCEEFRNLVDHRVSGFLYQNDIDFSKFFGQLFDDEGLRKKIGQRAGLDHKSRFSMRASLAQIETAFADAIDN